MTTLTPPISSPSTLAPVPGGLVRDGRVTDAPRGAPGLTVLAAPADRLQVAGYLLRHGPAVTLVESLAAPADLTPALAGGLAAPLPDPAWLADAHERAAERALEATVNAGFDVQGVETLPGAMLEDRLRAIDGAAIGCVVVGGGSARRIRRLTRAAEAPVLVLPSGAAPAGGPAILDALEADVAVPAAARALATEDAVVAARFGPVDARTMVRTAAHPALVPRLEDLAADLRRRTLAVAHDRAATAVALAGEHGFRARPAVCDWRTSVLDIASEHEGLMVVADTNEWRPPVCLRDALRLRRPVLFVPDPTARG